ncbi:MAG: hypothetical protein SGILL_010292, partial [Bacillariaceae sp.]
FAPTTSYAVEYEQPDLVPETYIPEEVQPEEPEIMHEDPNFVATEGPVVMYSMTAATEHPEVVYDGPDAIGTLPPTLPLREIEEPALLAAAGQASCGCGDDAIMGSWKCGNTVYYCPFVASVGICSNQPSNSANAEMVLLTIEQCAAYQTLSLDDACPGGNSLSNHVCYDVNADGTLASASKIDAQGCDTCSGAVPCTETPPPTEEEPQAEATEPPTSSPTDVLVIFDPVPPTAAPSQEPQATDAPTSSPTEIEVIFDPTPPTPAPSQEPQATEAPTDPIVIVDPLPPTAAPSMDEPQVLDTQAPTGGSNNAPPADCTMEYSTENTGSSVCPSSSESIVSLLKIAGAEDTDGSLANGDGVIYGIQLDSSMDTVTFQVNNIFSETSDIYVRHDITDDGASFLYKDCTKVPNAAACVEPSQNTFTAVCRNKKFAVVHLYFATTDETVLSFVEDATVHQCCHPDSYDPATTGVVELVYEIDCSCPNETSAGRIRMLRGTKA